MPTWLLLSYKLPTEPSARRVSVWRKLKRLGALLLHDATWVLPATDATREQFQWLAAEIKELEGTLLLWEASSLSPGQDPSIISQFLAQVEEGYRTLLTELAASEPDLGALGRRYRQLHTQDYFHSPLGEEVRAALVAAREGGT